LSKTQDLSQLTQVGLGVADYKYRPKPGCIKRCQIVVKLNILSSDLIGDNTEFESANQNGRISDLTDRMLTKFYATGPKNVTHMFNVHIYYSYSY
jgi:hypothetical protein